MDSHSVLRGVEVALGIGFVIFVHELGHFLVAKRVGIRVDVFSLGFGPRLLGFRHGGTDYRISAVPLGGYVKMAGEGPDEPGTGASDEFASKPVGARAAVIVAGVCMNAIFAVLGFLLAFRVGVRMDAPAVGRVHAGSAAESAGLRYGDRVIEVDGEAPLEFVDLKLDAAYASGPLEFVVDRRGQRIPIQVTSRRSADSPIQQIGIEPMDAVLAVDPGSAAANAGLRPGDWITAVGGKPASKIDDVLTAIRNSPGRPLELEVDRDGACLLLTLTPGKRPARTFGVSISDVPVIGKVLPSTPAAEAGLMPGDVVREVNGVQASQSNLRERIAATPAHTAVHLVIERSGAPKPFDIVPREPAEGGPPIIGISFNAGIVGDVAPDSPAAKAGLKPGCRIVSADGPIQLEGAEPGDEKVPLHLSFTGPGAGSKPVEVALEPVVVPDRFLGTAGLSFEVASYTKTAAGALDSIRLGFNRTFVFTKQVFLTLRGMFSKRIPPSTLSGPLGIVHAAYQFSEYGLGKLLYFFALISVNLAVLNIFPIPVLDGGHLVFLGIEKVKGTPVRAEIQAAAQWVGLAALLLLMIYVTKNDIARYLGG